MTRYTSTPLDDDDDDDDDGDGNDGNDGDDDDNDGGDGDDDMMMMHGGNTLCNTPPHPPGWWRFLAKKTPFWPGRMQDLGLTKLVLAD